MGPGREDHSASPCSAPGHPTPCYFSLLRSDIKEQLAPACAKQIFKLQMDAAVVRRSGAAAESGQRVGQPACPSAMPAAFRRTRWFTGCPFDLACDMGVKDSAIGPRARTQDFRADPQLYEACKEDASTLCKDVKFGGGRVQACLVRDRLLVWKRGHSLRSQPQVLRHTGVL
jgi:hypothetical protein